MEHYLASEFHRQQATRRAPAYQHLRRALQHAIENGELPAGQALPGERELGKQLGQGVYARLVGSAQEAAEDGSTQGLIDFFRGRHRG